MTRKWVDLLFDIGEIVYLKTDINQYPWMVTSIWLKETGLFYELSQGSNYSGHFGFEISKERNVELIIKNDK